MWLVIIFDLRFSDILKIKLKNTKIIIKEEKNIYKLAHHHIFN